MNSRRWCYYVCIKETNMQDKITLPTAVFGYHQNCGNWFSAVVRKTLSTSNGSAKFVWGNEYAIPTGSSVWVSKALGGGYYVCCGSFVVSVTEETAKTHLSVVRKGGNLVILEGEAGPSAWEDYYWEFTR